MKLSKAQLAVLANLMEGCCLRTSDSFGNTFWCPNKKKPKMDFVLPATARKLHSLGLIMRKTGREYTDCWEPNTFITELGLKVLKKAAQ